MKAIKQIFPIMVFVAALATFSPAQDEPIHVETNLVTVNVAVTDKSGNYIKGLKSEDFEVWDKNAKQPIDTFSAENVPVSFGIVYDMHSVDDERTRVVLDALRQFTKELKPTDYFFVSVFNQKGSLTTEFVPNSEQLGANFSDIMERTPNALYDAIFDASEKIRERRSTKQILIVITDGEDQNSFHTLKQLRAQLRSVNLPVYSVSFAADSKTSFGYADLYRQTGRQTLGALEASQLNTAALAEISKTTGGQTFERAVQNQYLLFGVFKKVQSEVENQYVLGFYPEDSDGKWHKLRVSVKSSTGKKYRLSNRRGYLSPKTK